MGGKPIYRKLRGLDEAKNVSVFEAHHATSIEYPCLNLLNEDDQCIILVPEDRYEPLPLVQPGAIAVKGRDTLAESSFISYNSCATPTTEAPPAFTGDLFKDMMTCISLPGETTLGMVYCDVSSGEAEQFLRVRISRQTRLYTRLGATEHHNHVYEMSSEEYDATWQSLEARPDWLQDSWQLIRMTSDRAIRHFWLNFASMGVETTPLDIAWKEPRGASTADCINKVSVPLKPSELQQHSDNALAGGSTVDECMSCLEEFSEEGAIQFVRLLCPKHHVLCKPCLTKFCKKDGLANVACFWCAVRLLDNKTAETLQPNYLNINATFRNDEAYTAFENHDRSCADLDQVHARDDHAFVVVRDDEVLEKLIHPIQHPERRRAHAYANQESTYEHWYPLLLESCPEADIFATTLRQCLKADEGKREKVSVLYTRYLAAIRTALRSQADPRMWPRFHDRELVDVIDDVPLRRGFEQHMDRVLSRVLRFFNVQRCQNHPGVVGSLFGWDYGCKKKKKVFHYHGDRVFFKSEMDIWSIKSLDSTLGKLKLR